MSPKLATKLKHEAETGVGKSELPTPASRGRVQRFQCRLCYRRFSATTFSIDYYAKRRVSFHRLLGLAVNAASIRGAARQLHVSPGAVSLRLAKLARQALALHGELTRRFAELLTTAAALWQAVPKEKRKLITDQHTAYPRALARRVRCRTHFFAANYFDREIRKDLAEHRRETHAERAGIERRVLTRALRHWLTRRAFLSQTVLSQAMLRAWVGAEHTPLRENWINARITPAYALA